MPASLLDLVKDLLHVPNEEHPYPVLQVHINSEHDTEPQPVALGVELERLHRLRQLRRRLMQQATKALPDKPAGVLFDKWHMHAMQSQAEPRDPVLPWRPSEDAVLPDLLEAGMPAEAAEALAAELARLSNKAVRAVQQVQAHPAKAAGPTPTLMAVEGDLWQVQLAAGAARISLNVRHALKMLALWRIQHGLAADLPVRTRHVELEDGRSTLECVPCDELVRLARLREHAGFLPALACCAARYEGIGGAGFHAAAPGSVFSVLRQRQGAGMEAFANPWNARYPRYFSAFLDTDAAFGSVGRFGAGGRVDVLEGCLEANPPFEPSVIESMLATMHATLERAALDGKAVTFAIIVPAWEHQACVAEIAASTWLHHRLILPQAEHGYTEGAQQTRKAQWRVSTCDTGLYILKTPAAARSQPWPGAAADLEFKRAFISQHVSRKHRRLQEQSGVSTREPAPRASAPATAPAPALAPAARPAPKQRSAVGQKRKRKQAATKLASSLGNFAKLMSKS